MKTISNINVHSLLTGASLLACGGGLAYPNQLANLQLPRVKDALSHGIPLISLVDVESSDLFISVAEIGDSSAPVMEKKLLGKGLETLERKIGKKATGIIPDEIGQESITIESAAILDLPILNSDLSGCRAVPTLEDSVFAKKGLDYSSSPLVVIKTSGEIKFIEKQVSLKVDEKIVRQLVPSKSVILVVGNAINGQLVKEYLDIESYNTCLKVGDALLAGKDFIKHLPSHLLFGPTKGTILSVEDTWVKGFDEKLIKIVSAQGTYEVRVKNEYMELTSDHYQFIYPKFIMLYDESMKRGLHSSEIEEGQKVSIIVADEI